MIDRDTKLRLLEIEDLPTLPEVISRILDATEDERSSASELSEILEMDHAISARILRLANSAFYALPNRVDTLRRAVVVIGFDAVRLLALATSVFDAFFESEQFALEPREFWMHAFGAAKGAHLLAEDIGGVESPEACFTAGLIHDIGKYLLAIAFKLDYMDAAKAARESGQSLGEAEKQHFGTHHGEVGAWIAQKWHFPEMLVDVIGNLYAFGRYTGPHRRELAIVVLADHLSRKAGFGTGGDPIDRPVEPPILAELGLREDDLPQHVERLSSFHEDTRRLLDLLTEG